MRIVFILLMIILSAVSSFAQPQIIGECVDDDGGENPFIAGTACYKSTLNAFDGAKCTKQGAYITDNCAVTGYDAQGKPTYSVGETYCMSDGGFDRKYIACTAGCQDNACVQEIQPVAQQQQLIKCSGGRGVFNNEEEIYDDLWKECPDKQALKSSQSLDFLRTNPSARYYECIGANKPYYAVVCVTPLPQQPVQTQQAQTSLAQVCKSTGGWWSEQAEAPYWRSRWCDCGNKEWKPDLGGCVYPGQTLISPDEQLCRSTGGRWTPGITYAPTRDDKGTSFGIQGITTNCDCGSKIWTRNGCAVLAPPKIGSPTWSTEPPKFGVAVTEPQEPRTNQQWSSTPQKPKISQQEQVQAQPAEQKPQTSKIIPPKNSEQAPTSPIQEMSSTTKAWCKDNDSEDVYHKSFIEGAHDDGISFKREDYCLKEKEMLDERVCKENKPGIKTVFCNCVQGACVKEEIKPQESVKQLPKIIPQLNKACKDSDGMNINSAGYVLTTDQKDFSQWYDDSCVDEKTVLERSCSENNDLINQSFKCEFGCAEGRCHSKKSVPKEIPVDEDSGYELVRKAYLSVKDTGQVVEFKASIRLDMRYNVTYNVTGMRAWSFNPFTSNGVHREQLAIGIGMIGGVYYDKPTFDNNYKVLKIRILPARPYESNYEMRGVADKSGCANDFQLIFKQKFETNKPEDTSRLLVRDGKHVCHYEFYNKLIAKPEFNTATIDFSAGPYGKIKLNVPIRCSINSPVQISKEEKFETKKSDKEMLNNIKSLSDFRMLGGTKYKVEADAETQTYISYETIMKLNCYYGPFDVVNYRKCGNKMQPEHIAYDVKGKIEKEAKISSCLFQKHEPACFEVVNETSYFNFNGFDSCFGKEFKDYWEDEAREHINVAVDCDNVVRQACTANPLLAGTPVGRASCIAALVSCKIIDLTPFMQCYNKATSKSYDYAKADCKRFGVQERFFTELK